MTKLKAFINRYPFPILILIITTAIILRIYYSYHKEGFHIDEILSFQYIKTTYDSTDGGFENQNNNKWLNGKAFTDYYFTLEKSNLKKDIKSLLRNTKDSPHPNLYYVALRTMLYKGTRGVDGPFKFYGIGLNIFFYCIGAFFLYLLFNKIYKNSLYALLAVFLYSISTGAISTSLFIRMYELLSLSIIMTCFFTFKVLGSEKPYLRDFIFLSLTSTMGYLSHYYYTIFICFLMLLIIYHYLVNKQPNFILYYWITFLQGFITAQAFYPKFIKGFFPTSYRAGEAYSKLDISFLSNKLTEKLWVTYSIINNNIVYFLPLVILCIAIFVAYSLYKRRKILVSHAGGYLIFISIGSSIIFIYLSPYDTPRYLYGLFPILISLITFLIRITPVQRLKYTTTIIICIIYIFNSFNVSNIAHLYKNNKSKLVFRENPDIPVYFLSTTHWKRGQVFAYFIEDQKYKLIIENEPVIDLDETGSNEIYLIIENDSRVNMVRGQIEKKNWLLQKEVLYDDFVISKIRKPDVNPLFLEKHTSKN